MGGTSYLMVGSDWNWINFPVQNRTNLHFWLSKQFSISSLNCFGPAPQKNLLSLLFKFDEKAHLDEGKFQQNSRFREDRILDAWNNNCKLGAAVGRKLIC